MLDEATPPPAMSFEELAAHRSSAMTVLDAREPADFAAGHLRGSVNVGLSGRFAEYAGEVLRPEQLIVLVCPEGRELEARIRLGRIGFDNGVGYLDGLGQVLTGHPEIVETSSRLTPLQLCARLDERPGLVLLDVRNPGELAAGKIPGAIHVPLSQLAQRVDELRPADPAVVYCASGFRSMIAASWLAARGFAEISDLVSGYSGWARAQSTPNDVTPRTSCPTN